MPNLEAQMNDVLKEWPSLSTEISEAGGIDLRAVQISPNEWRLVMSSDICIGRVGITPEDYASSQCSPEELARGAIHCVARDLRTWLRNTLDLLTQDLATHNPTQGSRQP